MKTINPEIQDETGKFKPGTSGNPNGRPKGISITEMVKTALEEIEPKTNKPWKELIIKRILLKATNDGDTQMLKAIWSYIDGMPKQALDIDSEVKYEVKIVQDNRLKDANTNDSTSNKELRSPGEDLQLTD